MGFMIQSKTLEDMQDSFSSAADEILQGINQKRPVWIRHHNDCDGYCAAMALEKAIIQRLHEFHVKESDVFFFYKRFPTRTPFYDYSDATRDISLALGEAERFNRKQPLLIIVDNGSSEEDLFALKKLQIYGIDVVVVDHHPTSTKVEEFLKAHVNPRLFDNETGLTASMLSAELAKLIDSRAEDTELLAATGGFGDKSDSSEMQQYLKLAEERGFTAEYLKSLAEVVDFEATQLLNMEGRQYVQDLLFGDYKKQSAIVDIVKGEIEQEKNKLLQVVKEHTGILEKDNYILGMIDTENYFARTFYSKITSLAKEYWKEHHSKPLIMLGYADRVLTVRADKNLSFDINELTTSLKEKYPASMLQGAGHPNAGSIHFPPQAKETVIEETKKYAERKNA